MATKDDNTTATPANAAPANTAGGASDQQLNPAPNDEPKGQPADGADQGGQNQDPPKGPDLDSMDPDERALHEARRDLEREEQGGGEGGEKPANADGQPPAEGQQQPQQQPQPKGKQQQRPNGQRPQQRTPVIPKARFDEETEKRRQAEAESAYWRGVAEASRANGQQPPTATQGDGNSKPAQPAKASSDDLIKAERAKLKDAANKLDRGEISTAEYEDIRGQVDDQIFAIRSEGLKPQAQDSRSYADDLILEQHAERLEAQHPGLDVVSDKDLETLTHMAYAEAAREGKPIRTGPAETVRLREKIARLADKFAPDWYPQEYAAAVGGRRGNAQPPAGGNRAGQGQRKQGGLSPEAAARLAKHDMASGMPPDPTTLGRGAPPANGEPTAAQLESMSEDAIAALPAATRHRIMGIT